MLSKYEKETVMNYNEQDEYVSIYTASRSEMKRCKELGLFLKQVHRNKKQITGWEYLIPKSEFTWGKKRRQKLTPAQREKRRLTLAQNRLRTKKS